MAVLVTGGAGYIGSHITHALADQHEHIVVLDDLSTGIRSLASSKAEFIQGDVGDRSLLREILKKYDVEEIIHLAGSTVPAESIISPMSYYSNNMIASHALIEVGVEQGVKRFIFSSTAAVYGSTNGPVSERTLTNPITPYGRSKLMTEWILSDASIAHKGFRHIVLRYFNVAGADPLGRTGHSTKNPTHLIGRACQVALGRAPYLDIFGADYRTSDGTGVRDYIHVTDLATAHLLALKSLRTGADNSCYNCGYGRGVSVLEVVSEIEALTGRKLNVRMLSRRPGDAPSVVASSEKLKLELNWRPLHESLRTIVSSALEWERRLLA